MADRGDRLTEPADHPEHDPLLIAALVGDDLTLDERIAAQAQIAECQRCAELHADLLAVSVATRALPVPPRPRDFTISAADARRLRVSPAGEPIGGGVRLAGVMTDPRTPHTLPPHASHDAMLVASLADHSLAPSDRAAAEALVAACRSCAALHDDLVTLSAATRAMPTPRRARDFTLTPDDALRLRPGGWRRFLATLGTSRDALTRPLALGLTTLGLAGLLVASLPPILGGSAASTAASPTDRSLSAPAVQAPPAAMNDSSTSAEGAAAGAAASPPGAAAPLPTVGRTAADAAPVAGAPAASPDANAYSALDGDASPAPGTLGVTGGSTKTQSGPPGQRSDVGYVAPEINLASDGNGVSMLVVVSGASLIAGLGLFAIRWRARRLRSS